MSYVRVDTYHMFRPFLRTHSAGLAVHGEIFVHGVGHSFGDGGYYIVDESNRGRERKYYCRSYHLGWTNKTAEEVAAIIRWMTADAWTAEKYHPFSKNGNCFCKELSKLLGVHKVPYSVNRAPRFFNKVTPGCAVRAGMRMWHGQPLSQTQPQPEPQPQPQPQAVGVPMLYY